MDKFEQYVRAAHQAVMAASNGQDLANELALLAPQEAELRILLQHLTKRPDHIKGGEAHAQNAAELRAKQPFVLSWAGGGTEQVIGWDALAKRLRLRHTSIRVLLSKGKGSFSRRSNNPATYERDILTVTRILLPGQSQKPKIGRPRTRPLTEAEYNASIGLA